MTNTNHPRCPTCNQPLTLKATLRTNPPQTQLTCPNNHTIQLTVEPTDRGNAITGYRDS